MTDQFIGEQTGCDVSPSLARLKTKTCDQYSWQILKSDSLPLFKTPLSKQPASAYIRICDGINVSFRAVRRNQNNLEVPLDIPSGAANSRLGDDNSWVTPFLVEQDGHCDEQNAQEEDSAPTSDREDTPHSRVHSPLRELEELLEETRRAQAYSEARAKHLDEARNMDQMRIAAVKSQIFALLSEL